MMLKNKSGLMRNSHLYEEAETRLSELLLMKKEKEESLKKAPIGKIHIIKSKNRIQFYLRKENSEKSGQYLGKKETNKIKRYVQKSYDEKVLKLVNKEIIGLERFLKNNLDIRNDIQRVYSDSCNELKELILPIDMSNEDIVSKWVNKKYQGKELSENVPFYETDNKERVRSKSELNIANMLKKHGIPYKYEYPLLLKDGVIIHPDFTVLNVKKRKIYYWEHRGMMDNLEYARHAVLRNKAYMKNGIYIGDNLVITEEMSNCPLGTNEIEGIIIKNFY